MARTHVKSEGHRSLGLKVKVETDGGDSFTSRGNVVG